MNASAIMSKMSGPSLFQYRFMPLLRTSKDGAITDENAAQFRREN